MDSGAMRRNDSTGGWLHPNAAGTRGAAPATVLVYRAL